jgi:Glycosyltransferase family 87
VAVSGLVVLAAVSAGTFAFDFLAYHQAAQRVLDGQRLYDPTVQQTGGFGLFYYPPPFVLAILPFGLLPAAAASWLWLGLSVAMLVGGIALLPVGSTVRWLTLLLAGLSWPVAYALKLGQVGPLLLLLFAIGWRWLDRPVAVGLSGALGAIVKIQPGLTLVWALLTRRFAAVAVGVAILIVAAVAATVVLGGIGVWQDYVALLRNVSDPITTPHNFTPGAAAYQAGVPAALAATVQLVSSGLVVIAVVVAIARTSADASFLVTVVASQLLSPVLWDHYAMLLLLPVAWLLERRQWWAVAIPLVTSAVTLFVNLPAGIYPVVFWIALVAVLGTGLRERRPLPA